MVIKVTLKQRRQSGSLIAEFAPTLFVIFITCFFPFMNLIGVAAGATTAMLITNESASTAAAQESYSNSLDSMYAGAMKFLTSNFAKFAQIRSAGGYRGCGIDLYTQVTSTGGAASMVGPNVSIAPPVDLTDNVYEFVAKCNYDVGPFISMSNVTGFSQIPGIGAPVHISFTATKMVEHPLGLVLSSASGNSSGSGGSSAPSLFDRSVEPVPSGVGAASYNYGNWRNPTVFQDIAAAGQTVVSINVVVIDASKPWQASGITVNPGQTAWIDTNAVGLWLVAAGSTALDANGWMNDMNDIHNMMKNSPSGGLIGYCGSTPPAVIPNNGGYSEPNLFLVGDTLTNYPLPNPGNLNFMVNDNAIADNSGTQLVRVIITQN